MENRVRLKMLTILLIEGLSSAQGGRLNVEEYQACATESQREELYIKNTQDIVNLKILGCQDCPAQWHK